MDGFLMKTLRVNKITILRANHTAPLLLFTAQ